MNTTYTQEQVDQALKTIPEELQEAIFSVQTADAIRNACTTQAITDERLGRVAEATGFVLMGLLDPAQFLSVLQSDIGIKAQAAKEIARGINRFVFFPVKAALEQLHELPSTKQKAETPAPIQEESVSTPKQEKKGPDAYRETTE